MQNTLSTQEKPRRKQIAFDLGEDKLNKYFPRSPKSRDRRYYRRAWGDITNFMEANNFIHRQYSVYDSQMYMIEYEVYALMWRMVRCLPWVTKCMNVMDVTDIGELQDLLPVAEAMEAMIELEPEAVS